MISTIATGYMFCCRILHSHIMPQCKIFYSFYFCIPFPPYVHVSCCHVSLNIADFIWRKPIFQEPLQPTCLAVEVCGFLLFFAALNTTVTPSQRFEEKGRITTNILALVLTACTLSVFVARLPLCTIGWGTLIVN